MILKKYLKNKYVVEWFREGRNNLKGISNCWMALTSSLHIIIDWIVWNRVNGWDICIRLDPLVGSQSYFKLSENLVSTLHSKGLKFLSPVASMVTGNLNVFNWKNAEMLDLSREKKMNGRIM